MPQSEKPKRVTTLKQKYDEAKAFVQKHQMAVACAVTAAGTYYLVRDVKSTVVNEQIQKLTTWNLENEIEHMRLITFVDNKGLREEFFDYVKHDADIL